MKKILLPLAIAMFLTTSAYAFNMPKRNTVPSTQGYDFLGEMMVTQVMQAGGNISMKGYGKNGVQLVTMTFKNESRPYCWWYVRESDAYSQGRCDVDNNSSYEYEFDSTGRTATTHKYRPQWPTAYK